MAQVLVRNLSKRTVDRLKARAKRNGRSLEAELRLILEREAEAPAMVGEQPAAYGNDADATWAALERIAARWPGITLPRERGAGRPFKPVKIRGKPLSESIIEDRE